MSAEQHQHPFRVLISTVGRRSYLVEFFRQALGGRGQVIATNCTANSPGMLVADHAVVVPPVSAPEYPEVVLDTCRRYGVGLLCSVFDLDLVAISPLKNSLLEGGTRSAVSSPEVVDICFDKWKTVQFASQAGIDTPKTYLSVDAALQAVSAGSVRFPLIVKPRWGTGSIGVMKVLDSDALTGVWRHLQSVVQESYLPCGPGNGGRSGSLIIQEYVRGQEFGLDVINDLRDEYVCSFAKHKVSMRSGETDEAVTVNTPEIEGIGRLIGTKLRHTGILDADIIRSGDRLCLLEMNPRFGGGYPFSHMAGADVPAALVSWAQGREADPGWLRVRPGIHCCKDIQMVRVNA
ncbi:MAG: ATP-grasp domain-containing protein [Verrucomicrobia bacterium]|jgi:carbamoyl-phosphate synthase large subunit|nr:ATP-grasp domain-containing protein [Verrucomicrobiota bacterium]